MNAVVKDAKWVFLKKGACSQTFCYLLDREFGHLKETEERAADPLAGGLMQGGHQCGMLWGASLAVGAESFRQNDDRDRAIGRAIAATRHLVDSFEKRTGSVNCRDITGCDFASKFGLLKALLLGRFMRCFRLAGQWAPEAIQAATTGLALAPAAWSEHPLSCASEVVRLMGGNDEEMVMVAGFAGGIGLSGNGCGALAAAIWMTVLELVRKNNWKYSLSDPVSGEIIKKFHGAADPETECRKITGRSFRTVGEHTEFIKSGGCDKLIQVLAHA
jgi:C_GCAxxG_C_C family probable redox protein